MDIYRVIIDPGLVVLQTDFCLMPPMFAFFSFFPTRKNGSDVE